MGQTGTEVTRELPPGDELPLEAERFRELLRPAISRLRIDLSSLVHLQVPRTIYRGHVILNGQTIMSPSYWDGTVANRLGEVWRSPETVALTNYLWDRNTPKQTFRGPDPDREAWARWIHTTLVFQPLLNSLEKTVIDRLVRGTSYSPWDVDSERVDQVVDDLVARFCERREVIRAFCPLLRLDLVGASSASISDDIRLIKWTPPERAAFVSLHHHEYLWYEINTPRLHDGLAIVTVSIPRDQQVDFYHLVTSRLDLLKWALFVALSQERPVADGVCVFEGPFGQRIGVLRRDNTEGVVAELDAPLIQQCIELVQMLRAAAAKGKELTQALWHFGRACIAPLPRDVLLESAMGMDGLLVPGGGEAAYRFRLHGATVLSSLDPGRGNEHYRVLDEIYVERSGAAHGRSAEATDETALLARKMVAHLILAVAKLILRGDVDTTDGVAIGVQRYVLRRAVS